MKNTTSSEPRSVVLKIRITPSLLEVLQKEAASERRSLSGEAFVVLDRTLKRRAKRAADTTNTRTP